MAAAVAGDAARTTEDGWIAGRGSRSAHLFCDPANEPVSLVYCKNKINLQMSYLTIEQRG